ncbi:histone H2A [Rhodotorula toruloides]
MSAESKPTIRKAAESRSSKAGLQFPVGRTERIFRKGNYSKRLGAGAPVFLAAVLEYLTAEILELAGNAAKDNKKKRIIPRHLVLAIRNDDELDKLLGNGAREPSCWLVAFVLTVCYTSQSSSRRVSSAGLPATRSRLADSPATSTCSGGVLPKLQPALLPGQHPRQSATPRTPKSGSKASKSSSGGSWAKKAPHKVDVQAESQWQESTEL